MNSHQLPRLPMFLATFVIHPHYHDRSCKPIICPVPPPSTSCDIYTPSPVYPRMKRTFPNIYPYAHRKKIRLSSSKIRPPKTTNANKPSYDY